VIAPVQESLAGIEPAELISGIPSVGVCRSEAARDRRWDRKGWDMLEASVKRVALAAILLVTLVAASCSGDDGNGGDTGGDTGGATGGGGSSITIVDFAYDPSTLSVSSGSSEIEVTNEDDADHTFTLDDGSVDQEIAAGESATVTVDISESTGFHCTIHPDMTGTLEVA
jgi:plastocyanin